jgi:predicted nucleic acid-binding protein
MYLIDTNVVSELRRERPHGAVLAWLDTISSEDLMLSAVTIGEIQLGIEITRRQDERRAVELDRWLEDVLVAFRIIDMDARAFRRWGMLMKGLSRDLSEDAMIAATAQVRGLTVVTRNTRDFVQLGVRTLNPFEHPRPPT